MKLLLIAPSSGRWRRVGRTRVFNGKTFRFSMLSLLSVAAETPRDWEITIVDEQVEDVPFDATADLVGITCMTALAPRAYEIADRFRARGVPVVLGGMHPTFCSDEALAHADAVVAGDAEGVWADVLNDLRAGHLSGVYRSARPPCLDGLKPPPRHLLRRGRYGTLNAVQATRGCPQQCEFCAVTAFHGNRFRKRPVAEVVDEIDWLPGRFFMFVDDNIAADRDYAKELFAALAPLRRHWVSQATIRATEDEELVRLAAESGCVGLFVGLETFSERNLASVNKGFNKVEDYRAAIETLHRHGIGIEAGIVFGFDSDDATTFRHTINTLEDLQVDAIQASIRTPLPGTKPFTEMQDRIFERDWSHYDFHRVVYQPVLLSSDELQAGHDWVTREFYRPWRIARRMERWVRRPRGRETLKYAFGINAAYYGRTVKWGIRGFDPERARARAMRGVTVAGMG